MSEAVAPATDVKLGRFAAGFFLAGLAVTAVSLIGVFNEQARKDTLHSYLFAVILFMSLTLGCFGMTMLQHVLQGKWGLPILRIFEAGGGARNFILMFVLLLPILIFAKDLYPWATDQVKVDPVLAHRADHYLNWPDIIARLVVYFGGWILYAAYLRNSVKRQEADGRFKHQQRRANWASPGLVFVVLSVTFAYTDFVMALDPHWWSTMYGLWFIAGMALGATSLAAIIACVNAHRAPYNQIVNKNWTRDIGNLMFTFVMLWGYTNLGQYIILWHGNLPETTSYLINRSLGNWSYLSFVLVIGQFFVPFFLLLSPTVKATPKYLASVGVWILIMRLVDHFHVIEPFFRAKMFVSPVDVLALVGVGCLWAGIFSVNVSRMPLFPTYDPRLLEVEHAH